MKEIVYCYICNTETDDELICDTCDRHYCDDCSYCYTLHYQYEGCQCYQCADQSRVKPITKDEIRDNAIKIILNE
jgi:hypothetical protein